jgi:hypothetical protein
MLNPNERPTNRLLTWQLMVLADFSDRASTPLSTQFVSGLSGAETYPSRVMSDL